MRNPSGATSHASNQPIPLSIHGARPWNEKLDKIEKESDEHKQEDKQWVIITETKDSGHVRKFVGAFTKDRVTLGNCMAGESSGAATIFLTATNALPFRSYVHLQFEGFGLDHKIVPKKKTPHPLEKKQHDSRYVIPLLPDLIQPPGLIKQGMWSPDTQELRFELQKSVKAHTPIAIGFKGLSNPFRSSDLPSVEITAWATEPEKHGLEPRNITNKVVISDNPSIHGRFFTPKISIEGKEVGGLAERVSLSFSASNTLDINDELQVFFRGFSLASKNQKEHVQVKQIVKKKKGASTSAPVDRAGVFYYRPCNHKNCANGFCGVRLLLKFEQAIGRHQRVYIEFISEQLLLPTKTLHLPLLHVEARVMRGTHHGVLTTRVSFPKVSCTQAKILKAVVSATDSKHFGLSSRRNTGPSGRYSQRRFKAKKYNSSPNKTSSPHAAVDAGGSVVLTFSVQLSCGLGAGDELHFTLTNFKLAAVAEKVDVSDCCGFFVA